MELLGKLPRIKQDDYVHNVAVTFKCHLGW